ncbi:hypothetical protein SERLA73DRAFT_180709 [Serpula lacrymans var. lacrymans S7.3]|uniref:Uncharacterized protein n=2 Tax=Serpula lacrymans var. lacrymans TaxID=341189 RepID=F8PW60_SERL3|nr:uncharacterized protein SERLADRAFT_466414 [Serpula lacrymans var. lacrymans S7.9]EGO00236.1 hypothetical protein SERLA73DRAFT_180709 [Serpula lacrymans var. lacrymans S7.3]EGO25793.1 hypothetical protein SERLADRAFT_466414 [Serpula lacrymans var. lacrymans S7.9]
MHVLWCDINCGKMRILGWRKTAEREGHSRTAGRASSRCHLNHHQLNQAHPHYFAGPTHSRTAYAQVGDRPGRHHHHPSEWSYLVQVHKARPI